ncbi:hypothetical protein [Oleiagrimonas sp. C23AA]|uniref:hypothetical protein n=1 Tax=Oleiagrimonas sp. C23AA TaxID=2719047 RepID=UPI0014236EB0|nr:hypothetical protein [Oleiagrimonas sp. C23AA]NII10678.1 hypothetical protein [Oleiagrimonas sp. C23AA]
MFCALAASLALAGTTSVVAAPMQQGSDIKALHSLIDRQQQQIDQQQKEIQMLRQSVMKLEHAQATQQQPSPAAAAPSTQVAAETAKSQVPSFVTSPGVTVAMHGIISATAFHQSRNFYFGNGQNAEMPLPGAANDGALSGVDVRNTRFWFDITGPRVGSSNWLASGRIEADFFGGFNGSGAYSRQQATPRLRQAYVDLTNPDTGTTVRMGQQWELMFPISNVPSSLAHVAFPLGFGAGYIGWRYPGVVLMQDLNHGTDSGAKWRLDLGAFDGNWSGPGDNLNYQSAGNANFHPQLQARINVKDGDWLGYAAATWSRIDLSGVGGSAPTPIQSTITSTGYEVGGAWTPGPWMFKGQVYTGKGLGQLFGDLVQFGDISEKGGFVQAGYKFTPNWSANLFYAYSKPDTGDVIDWLGYGASGRLKNRQAAINLEYSQGPYALGLEWLRDTLDTTTDGSDRTRTSGNQFSISAMYKF